MWEARATCCTGTTDGRVHASGSGRRSGDVDTPEGTIDNSQSRGGFASVGLAWTGEHSYFGGSYGYDNTKYGMPFVEEGQIQLTPRRQMFGLRAGADNLMGRSVVPRPVRTGSTSTTSSKARRSERSSRTTPPISTSRPSTARGPADGNDRRVVPDARVQRPPAQKRSPRLSMRTPLRSSSTKS